MNSLSNDNRFKYRFLKYYEGYTKKRLVKFYKLMYCIIRLLSWKSFSTNSLGSQGLVSLNDDNNHLRIRRRFFKTRLSYFNHIFYYNKYELLDSLEENFVEINVQ